MTTSDSGVWQEYFATPRWSIALAGFLYYLCAVVTLRVPGADVGIVIAMIALALNPGALRIGRTLTIGLVWVLWLWCCTVLSPDPGLSFEQSWDMTKVWLIAFVAFNVLRTRETLRLCLAVMVLCFVAYPVRGALLNYLSGITLQGRAIWNLAYENPNDLASFALLYGSCSLALAVLTNTRWIRIAAIAASGVMLLLILLTQSRGTFLGASAVIMIGLVPRLRNVKVAATAALVIAVALFFAPSSMWERVRGLGAISVTTGMAGVDPEGSAEQRWQIAQVAWHVASSNPVFGIGPGRYRFAHAQYAAQLSGQLPLAGGTRDAHNTYLSTAAQSGFIGLIIFLTLAAQSLRGLGRRFRVTSLAAGRATYILALGVLGVLLAGFFSSNQYINILHLQFALVESLLLVSGTASSSMPRPARSSASAQRRRGRFSAAPSSPVVSRAF